MCTPNPNHLSVAFAINFYLLKEDAGVDEFTALEETIKAFEDKFCKGQLLNGIFRFLDGTGLVMCDNGKFDFFFSKPEPYCFKCHNETKELFSPTMDECLKCSLNNN